MVVLDAKVEAEPNTIVVPDDYQTIADAIGNATEGDTIFVKKGTCPEHMLVINQTISLIGEDPGNTVIENMDSTWLGKWPNLIWTSAIDVHADHVKISGFKITVSGASFCIRGNGDGIQIVNNNISSGEITLSGSNQTIANNTINGRVDVFVHCVGSYNAITSNNVSGSGGGIRSSGSYNILCDNIITADSGICGGLDVSGYENIVAKNNVTNFVGVGGSRNIVYGNTISSNLAIVGNDYFFYANYIQGVILGNRVNDASNNTFYHNYFDFVENKVLPEGEKTFTVWEGYSELTFWITALKAITGVTTKEQTPTVTE